MEYEIKEETLVVYFYGEIDGSNVSLYRNKLNVGLVLGRYQQLSKEGRKLAVSRLSNTAYKVFELSGLFEIIEYLKEVQR